MFNHRLFLHSFISVLRREDRPGDVHDYFGETNALLRQAGCFVADSERGRRSFKLAEKRAGAARRHRADVVIVQPWGLPTLVKRAANGGWASRAWVLRSEATTDGVYAPRTTRGGRARK